MIWIPLLLLSSIYAQAGTLPVTAGVYFPPFDDGKTEGPFTHVTTRLVYREFDTDPEADRELLATLALAKSSGFVLQIGFEPNLLSNQDLVSALQGKGKLTNYSKAHVLKGEVADTVWLKFSEKKNLGILPQGLLATRDSSGVVKLTVSAPYLNYVYQNLLKWARVLGNANQPIYLRPMSEMNLDGAMWELGSNGAGNTAIAFAQAWIEIRAVITSPHVYFLFDVSSWSGIEIDPKIHDVLDAIPPDEIDALGIHPYSATDNGGTPPSFKSIVQPWESFFSRMPGYGSKPIVIGEMGVKRNHQTDAERAAWIASAFQYARAKHYSMVTYYDGTDGDSDYTIDPTIDPLSFSALQNGLSVWVKE